MSSQQDFNKSGKQGETLINDTCGVGMAIVAALQTYYPVSVFLSFVSLILLGIAKLKPGILPGILSQHPERLKLYSAAVFVLSAIAIFGARTTKPGDSPPSALTLLANISHSVDHIGNGVDTANKSLASIDQKVGGLEKETSTDPRKELSKLGVDWTRENFLRALNEGDTRAVTLFQEGGMELDRKQLWNFVIDDSDRYHGDTVSFSDAVAKALLVHKAAAPGACRPDEVFFNKSDYAFGTLIDNAERIAFLRNFCGASALQRDIDAAIENNAESLQKIDSMIQNPVSQGVASNGAPISILQASYNEGQQEAEKLQRLKEKI